MKIKELHNERSLVEDMISGDSGAFSAIYNWYSPRLYANLLRLVKDRDLAQEFLQDVFLKVWQTRSRINPDLSLKSYLFQISKHLVYNYYSREKIKIQIENYLSYIQTELHTGLEDDFAYKESKKILDQAIDKLPPIRRKVYILCKIEGNSYQQVSEMLNISTSTISDHIVRATKFIKEHYASEINGAAMLMIWLIYC